MFQDIHFEKSFIFYFLLNDVDDITIIKTLTTYANPPNYTE